MRELVKLLPPQLNATFVTANVPIALELLDHPNVEVIFLGNKLLKSAQMAVGAEVVQRLSQIRADLCLLGTNSIDPNYGITDLEWEIIEVKKAMIACSKKVVSLAISEKLNTVQHLQVCTLDKIDVLVTELDPKDEKLTNFIYSDLLII